MKTTFLFFLLCSAAAFAREGGHVGNGGDIVNCRPEAGSKFSGYYLLDYLLTYDYSNENANFMGPEEDSIALIQSALKNKLPELGKDFHYFVQDFRAQVFARPDLTRSHIWKPQRLGLNPISDEFIFQRVPANCQDQSLPGKINLIQAVIREERPQSVIFLYDELQLKELRRQSAAQLAMLMVHEWLWHYSANANIVRDANRYLFSREFQADSKFVVAQKLEMIGVDLSREGRRPLPQVVEVNVTSCNPKDIKPISITAPADVGVKIHYVNKTNCYFGIYRYDPDSKEKLDRVWHQPLDAPGFGVSDHTVFYKPWTSPKPFEIALLAKPWTLDDFSVILRIYAEGDEPKP